MKCNKPPHSIELHIWFSIIRSFKPEIHLICTFIDEWGKTFLFQIWGGIGLHVGIHLSIHIEHIMKELHKLADRRS